MSEPFTSEEIEQVVWRLFATIDARNAENTRLREQAEALAAALARALFYSRGSTAKYVLNQLARAEAVLRTYREANHE